MQCCCSSPKLDGAMHAKQVNPVSAAGMLDVLQVPQGKYVLQSAANSVLGRQFIQLAKSKGVRTINIVRRHDHDQELKDLG